MSILASPPTVDDSPEAFLGELFTHLATYRTFPKFQFERRVSDLIALFLPEIVRAHFGWNAEVVAPEFPLKKADELETGKKHNQSTNVDYLLRVGAQSTSEPRWLLVELKTDMGSVNPDQIRIYLDTLAEKPIGQLVDDVDTIWAASQAKDRYQQLQRRLERFESMGELELLYLTPGRASVVDAIEARRPPEHVRQRFHILTFEEICGLEVQRYPAVWKMLCEKLLRPLSECASK